jgi:hypothetical protein
VTQSRGKFTEKEEDKKVEEGRKGGGRKGEKLLPDI